MTSPKDVRKRKLNTNDEQGGDAAPNRRKSSSPSSASKGLPRGLKLSFLCLVLSATLLLVFFGVYMDSTSPFLVRLASKLGYTRNQFAVIIDAGSTGSRVLAYKFDRSFIDNKLVLSEELFKERKPGLSSFAENPTKGAHSIKLLLDDAKAFIPKEKWASTPLVLKATAGLRLLPQNKAENLLNAVREVFAKSEFSIEPDAVEIMDGTDEGIFSWFTVNFLLGRLSKTNQAAALDLGGGSTQVTFAPTDPDQLPLYEKYMHEVNTLNRKIDVFTHSYLGLGLMAARHSVFTKGYNKDVNNVESVCVNPIINNRTWTYSNVEYKISGKPNTKSTAEEPVVDFEQCLEAVKTQVLPLVKPKPFTLKQHTVAAFSYYFERAIESGLIDPFRGGEITVSAFRKKAEEVCSIANDEQPFMCFDLTYISVLLHEGFGLGDGKKIKLYKKIDGHEISWALGCAYNVLTSDDKYNS
ncbi:ectonucleoside triphosphate diphosphohydrolase 5 isoform X1 [Rhagoletis pomonella]|uniref:ectonucleoside triphosphate diphosphohydrolase 5 isoform X1 n=2 Tax=Rhagoletis pomonella TaxID=28610 RepID=UPI00177E4D15|nr:ectonucleoside triphosphate diphosphohydrolase 5 isoform X1 [Rhagoletis pomonella]XP_036321847.1 ectonucleoside triphosphate diphosphohydrolase 5 isoform X1 [Rhagoletis pomonella]